MRAKNVAPDVRTGRVYQYTNFDKRWRWWNFYVGGKSIMRCRCRDKHVAMRSFRGLFKDISMNNVIVR